MEFPRIKRLPPYVFNVVGDLKQAARRAGEDIIDFSMGNPDGPTPPHIVQSLVESAQKPQNHRYSVSRGIYKLRLAICDWYRRRFDVELDADHEAIVTIGSKEGIGQDIIPNPIYKREAGNADIETSRSHELPRRTLPGTIDLRPCSGQNGLDWREQGEQSGSLEVHGH